MNHRILLFLTVTIVVLFALLTWRNPPESPTSAAVEDEGYAYTVHDIVSNFFGIIDVQFPEGSCGEIAKGLYKSIAHTSMDQSSGFLTEGNDKLATVNFVIDRINDYGTIDMAKGRKVISDGSSDSFISMNAETIVRVPKEGRTTYFSMDLWGSSLGNFIVGYGRFSTPSVDCDFVNKNGKAACDCKAHTIMGIRVAGITSFRPPPVPPERVINNG